MNVETLYLNADQNWQDEQTTYWFSLDGTDYGTGYKFDSEVYGIVESGVENSVIVDEDGNPLTEGDHRTIAVRNNVAVTDDIRADAAAGF